MIKRIQFIKDFGIFKKFKWTDNSSLQDFKLKNIIYGWNYSGKTTLSRIFSSLRDSEIHPKYQKGEFKIINQDGKEFTEKNIDKYNNNIKVFNSEYIKRNLKWDSNESLD